MMPFHPMSWQTPCIPFLSFVRRIGTTTAMSSINPLSYMEASQRRLLLKTALEPPFAPSLLQDLTNELQSRLSHGRHLTISALDPLIYTALRAYLSTEQYDDATQQLEEQYEEDHYLSVSFPHTPEGHPHQYVKVLPLEHVPVTIFANSSFFVAQNVPILQRFALAIYAFATTPSGWEPI